MPAKCFTLLPFYASYREQDGKLQFPMLAVNSTQGYEKNNNGEDDEGFF